MSHWIQPKKLSDIKALHVRTSNAGYLDACRYCYAPWPCDTDVAVTEVERLKAKIELAFQQAEYGANHGLPAQDTLDSVLSALGEEK